MDIKTVDIEHKNYLGDIKVVQGLLRAFAGKALAYEGNADEFGDMVGAEAKRLANILLGGDKSYPGPAWFGPGQIDVAVAHQQGIVSENPTERVAGGLIRFVAELLALAKSNDPDWQAKSGSLVKKAVYLFMGIPAHLAA